MDELQDAVPWTSVDPFKASLTLTVKRRQLQGHTLTNLYARPSMRVRKAPPRITDTATHIPSRRRPSVPYIPSEHFVEEHRSYFHATTPPCYPIPSQSTPRIPFDYNHSSSSSHRQPKWRPEQGEPFVPSPTRSVSQVSHATHHANEPALPPIRSPSGRSTPPPENSTPVYFDQAVCSADVTEDDARDVDRRAPIRLPSPHELPYNTTSEEQSSPTGWRWDHTPDPYFSRTSDEVENPMDEVPYRMASFHSASRKSSVRSIATAHDAIPQKDQTPPLPPLHEASVHTISRRTTRKSPSTAHIQNDEKRLSSDPEALKTSSIALDATVYLKVLLLDTLPRQIYLHCLLRLPYMYYSRINRIFRTAGLSVEDIKEGMLDRALQEKEYHDDSDPWAAEIIDDNTVYDRLQKTWNSLVDSLIYEWTNLNIISALLLAAILTLLQIDTASSDPLPRYTAFSSMICALMSLLCGYIYLIRFESVRNSYKMVEWANEIQQTRTGIWWNMWIFLALPATWLVWSVILYLTCAMSLVWRNGTEADMSRAPMSPKQALVGCVIVTVLLAIGMVYLVLVILTLRRYGEKMDEEWHCRLSGWVDDVQREMRSLDLPRSTVPSRIGYSRQRSRNSITFDMSPPRIHRPQRSPTRVIEMVQG